MQHEAGPSVPRHRGPVSRPEWQEGQPLSPQKEDRERGPILEDDANLVNT